jgi:hypothetical protein
MVGSLLNDELETIWKGAAVAKSWYSPGNCLEEMRKIRKSPLRIAGIPLEMKTEHKSEILPLCQT